MKSWFKVVLMLVLVALVGGVLIGCGVLGPEATVKSMFQAVETLNADKAGSYYTERFRESAIQSMKVTFAFILSMEITNLKTTLASQTDDTATVTYEFDIEVKPIVGEGTMKRHSSGSTDLVKEDGKWLINEPFGGFGGVSS